MAGPASPPAGPARPPAGPPPALDPSALDPSAGADDVTVVAGAVAAAVRPPDGLTHLQDVLITSVFHAMTGASVDLGAVPQVGPRALADRIGDRPPAFRARVVQLMLLAEIVLVPLPVDVPSRVEAYAAALGVADSVCHVARRAAQGSRGLVAADFERNGYLQELVQRQSVALHVSPELDDVWALVSDDPALAGRWRSLGDLPAGTLGRGVFDCYQARGFAFPGLPGSAPPLLAQHDWVHVLADYGTTVDSEIEVFAFIAHATDDPRAFSLLAMVVSLFETGYLAAGAGLFTAEAGHLSRPGMSRRLADALRRGAGLRGRPDFLAVDWFALADRPLDVVRAEFGVPPKGAAVAAASPGPWQPGGMSPYQMLSGRRLAQAEDRPYDAHGGWPVTDYL